VPGLQNPERTPLGKGAQREVEERDQAKVTRQVLPETTRIELNKKHEHEHDHGNDLCCCQVEDRIPDARDWHQGANRANE
jgi:hypothetical protein